MRLALPDSKARVERVMLLHLAAFDWNCPQHITPRFTEAQIAEAIAPLKAHAADLAAKNERLRGKIEALQTPDLQTQGDKT